LLKGCRLQKRRACHDRAKRFCGFRVEKAAHSGGSGGANRPSLSSPRARPDPAARAGPGRRPRAHARAPRQGPLRAAEAGDRDPKAGPDRKRRIDARARRHARRSLRAPPGRGRIRADPAERQPPAESGPALEVLAAALRKAPLRRHVATALGLVGDPAAVPALARALEREKDAGNVEALAVALSRLKERDALAARARASPVGRAACLHALNHLDGGPEIVVEGFAQDSDDDVRAAVVDACRLDNLPLPAYEEAGERAGIMKDLADLTGGVAVDGAGRRIG